MSFIKLLIVCTKLSLSFSTDKVGTNFSWLSQSSSLIRNNFELSLSSDAFSRLISSKIWDKLDKNIQQAFIQCDFMFVCLFPWFVQAQFLLVYWLVGFESDILDVSMQCIQIQKNSNFVPTAHSMDIIRWLKFWIFLSLNVNTIDFDSAYLKLVSVRIKLCSANNSRNRKWKHYNYFHQNTEKACTHSSGILFSSNKKRSKLRMCIFSFQLHEAV